MTFAKQLRELRNNSGMTQPQAARLIGVSLSALAKWETQNRTPIKITQEAVIARFKSAHKML